MLLKKNFLYPLWLFNLKPKQIKQFYGSMLPSVFVAFISIWVRPRLALCIIFLHQHPKQRNLTGLSFGDKQKWSYVTVQAAWGGEEGSPGASRTGQQRESKLHGVFHKFIHVTFMSEDVLMIHISQNCYQKNTCAAVDQHIFKNLS